MIRINNVTKIYGKSPNSFVALNDVTFHIHPGASVAIIGKSGSGKSSLLNIMSGLDRPQSGEVIIDNRDILAMKQDEIDRFRANDIGFIFQSFYVDMRDTCYQNVALVCEIANMPYSQHRRSIMRALEEVDLADKSKLRAADLSGGEKQRLAIARAIVNRPKILFADEPTGNLDSETGRLIEDLLFRYNKEKGVTLIIVTHDIDLARRCDLMVRIHDGKIMSSTEKESSIRSRKKKEAKERRRR